MVTASAGRFLSPAAYTAAPMATPGSLAPKLTSIPVNEDLSSIFVLATQLSARPPSKSRVSRLGGRGQGP